MSETEQIRAAAIRSDYTGQTFLGPHHAAIINRLAGYGFPTPIAGDCDLFWTTRERAVHRQEALRIAREAKQITEPLTVSGDFGLDSSDMLKTHTWDESKARYVLKTK